MDLQFPLTIAYNMEDKKIGCALAQAAMGATLPNGQLGFHFDAKYWELNPSKCKLYIVKSKEEFDFMIKVTKGDN